MFIWWFLCLRYFDKFFGGYKINKYDYFKYDKYVYNKNMLNMINIKD